MPDPTQSRFEGGIVAAVEWTIESSEGEAPDFIPSAKRAKATSSCVVVSSQRWISSASVTLPRHNQVASNAQDHHAKLREVISCSPPLCPPQKF